jgi:hypothetical protein
VRERLPDFERLGVRVAPIVQAAPADAARFCARHGLEGLCVPDPERRSHRAVGLGRTSWWSLLFPPAPMRARRGEARRRGFGPSLRGTLLRGSDVRQLPGALLVARGGRILWLHRGADPADLPAPDRLLEVAARHLAA